MTTSGAPDAPDGSAGAGPVPVQVLRSQLRSLPVAERLRLSLFVILLGLGYTAGFVYIQLTTIPEGEVPNPVKMPGWIANKYHGDPTPLLIRMVKPGGKMRKNMKEPDTDIPTLQAWYDEGMKKEQFPKIRAILEKTGSQGKSCLDCHSESAEDGSTPEAAKWPLVTYENVKPEMRTGGMSVNDLARLSHFHLIGMSLMALGFTWVWMKTAVRPPWRGVFMVLPFVAIFCDIGGWWLTWLHPLGAYMVLLGGTLYGISSLVLTAGPLYDMWCSSCAPSPAAAPKSTGSTPAGGSR
ncbi:MAG TPA: hypothetical protein VL860_08365 [Planctomycetota bacterium]|nr:hypothetical protein [Planctomycetota bacterium]